MGTWKIGDVTVTSVMESQNSDIGGLGFPDVGRDAIDAIPWLKPHFLDADGKMLVNIQSFLVESCGKRIIVDTCVGNDKERPLPEWDHQHGPYLQAIAEAGAPRESVNLIVCTHLHIDHVGWNTMLEGQRWVPTFPHARHIFAAAEWDHWKDAPEAFGPVIADSVRPIVDAGLADLVATDYRITDELQLEPTFGHTPGHCSVRIRSRGEEAVITGDLMHHPCQIAHPEWSPTFDHDPEQSRRTRRAFVERCADTQVLVIGSHFAGPTAGRIARDGGGYRLVV